MRMHLKIVAQTYINKQLICYKKGSLYWPKILLFMLLIRAPEVLKDLAPGSQPPFLIYNEEVRTDTNKIEEFLEETLAPPRWVRINTTRISCFYDKFLHLITLNNDVSTSYGRKDSYDRIDHQWTVNNEQWTFTSESVIPISSKLSQIVLPIQGV